MNVLMRPFMLLLGCVLCFVTPTQALACPEGKYQQAAAHVAGGSFALAEEVLGSCPHDQLAEYLLGMLPRFASFSDEQTDDYKRALSRAAEAGMPAASAIEGIRLIEANQDRTRAASLLTSAYEADDDWAVWMGFKSLGAQGERLSIVAIERVEQLAAKGFPLAFGVLAQQALFRASDQSSNMTPEQLVTVLGEVSELAAKGAVRGDYLAVLALIRVNEEFKANSDGLKDLYEALTTPESEDATVLEPSVVSSAYKEWKQLMPFSDMARDRNALLQQATAVCSRTALKQRSELCEIRSVVDHFVCMEPFAEFYRAGDWSTSLVYENCRSLRLGKKPGDPTY